MNGTLVRTARKDTPARWQKAAARAVAEGIEVRQCAGSGLWIATSGTDAGTAYELDIFGSVAAGCSCLAGMNDDPVCKHRAAFYLLVGSLSLDPEPEPPAPAIPATVERAVAPDGFFVDTCRACSGLGYGYAEWGRDCYTVTCRECGGSGRIPEPAAIPAAA